MRNLANDFTGEGRYSEEEKLQRVTMDLDRRVLGPEHPLTALSTYNIGCIVARKGNRDEAFTLLLEAVDHGLAPTFDLVIEKDPLLMPLHGDPRFAALVAHAKERAPDWLKRSLLGAGEKILPVPHRDTVRIRTAQRDKIATPASNYSKGSLKA
ncbi:MAG: tetratricopeptide repeat protein [Bryobacteraceae bacterium]